MKPAVIAFACLLSLHTPATAATPTTIESSLNSCGGTLKRSTSLDWAAQQPGAARNLQAILKTAGYIYINATSLESTNTATILEALSGNCKAYVTMKEYGLAQRGATYTLLLGQPRISATLSADMNTELDILKHTNAARARGQTCGGTYYPPAPAVTWNANLAAAARGYAQWQAARNTTGHVDPTLGTPGDRAAREGWYGAWGENLAYGPATAADAVAAWVKSPAHCRNLMNTQHTTMGAGLAINAHSDYGTYWGQLFGH